MSVIKRYQTLNIYGKILQKDASWLSQFLNLGIMIHQAFNVD